MRMTAGLFLAIVITSLAFPCDARAQRDPVLRALVSLDATLDGPYGDEGLEVSKRFDELTQALAGWDRSIPAEPVGDPSDPITAYLTLTRSTSEGFARINSRLTLLSAVQDVIHGRRTQPPSRFPPMGLMDEAGGGAPRFPLARYADVFASALQGQIDVTIARMKAASATDPLMVDPASRSAGMQEAAGALRRGSLRAALTALENVVKASPNSSEAHRMLATAAALAGDSRTSAQHYQTALKIRPDDERSWMAFANMQVEGGRVADAVSTLEKGIAAIPGSGRLRWRLAGLLVRLDRVDEALAQYTEAERLTPVSGAAAVHQAVATSASVQLDFARAAAAGERRVRANLNDTAAHRDLANIYVKQGRQDDAFAELAIAAWLDPDDPLTLVALGQGLMADGKDLDAVAALERAVLLRLDLREARYALAQALTRISRRADAERHLAEFERQRKEAVVREQRAIDIDAARSDAAMKSAAGLHRQAIEIRQRVIMLEPDVAQNYLDLAEALVKAGRLSESLQYFVKTAEMDGVAEVHLRLADVLARLGRTRESALARETYERLRLEDFRRQSRQ